VSDRRKLGQARRPPVAKIKEISSFLKRIAYLKCGPNRSKPRVLGAAAWVLLAHYELTRFLFFGVEARFEKKSDKLMSLKVILETYP
jgi:hypothetical protein